MNESELVGAGRLILIVEDEPGLLEAMALAFELEGFKVACAHDGEDALAQLADTVPDLIIADYMMPRMNGLDMIRHIRSDSGYDQVPILLMSAALPSHVDPSVADGFLKKPTSVTQLLQAALGLLD